MGTSDILILYVIWFVLAFAVASYLLKSNS
jgi:hypothetical protein